MVALLGAITASFQMEVVMRINAVIAGLAVGTALLGRSGDKLRS